MLRFAVCLYDEISGITRQTIVCRRQSSFASSRGINAHVWVFFLILLLTTMFACRTQLMEESADVIYTDAVIWTGAADRPWAEAIAVKDEKILSVGTVGDVESYRGPETLLIELGGAFVTPGLIDNHVHFMSGGFQLAGVDLRSADTPEEFARRINAFVESLPAGRWVTGGDWDHERWGGQLPHRRWIDDQTKNTPVFVNRLDGHMALANTIALNLAGITRDTPDPEGGTIIRDTMTGEPTGLLKDKAMSLVFDVITDIPEDEQDEALHRAMSHALSLGVTQVHDMGSMGGWDDLATYRRAYEKDALTMRIYSFVPIDTWERLAEFVRDEGRGDDWLRWGGLKGFVDGSLGSTTAWFYDEYSDEPGATGLIVTDTVDLRNWVLQGDTAEFQIAVHAIGDRANDLLLDIYADAARQNGDRDRRFRIEHAQHLSLDAIGRFAAQDVVPAMQPYHAIDDGRWAEKRIGMDRLKTTYAFRTLLDAGASLGFSSDWTVAPMSPLEGIYAAVTRRTIDDANPNGWVPEQKISVEEALRAYTAANAFAGFQEDRLGTAEAGKLADFVVLSENLFEIDPVRIKDVRVLRTIVGGVERFAAK